MYVGTGQTRQRSGGSNTRTSLADLLLSHLLIAESVLRKLVVVVVEHGFHVRRVVLALVRFTV
jgi:hypothetical protein